MGCDPDTEYGCTANSEKATPVTLTHAFIMQQFEVTRGEWSQFAEDPTDTDHAGAADCTSANCPVVQLTWFEVAAYANWLSAQHVPPLDPCYDLVSCTGAPGSHMACEKARPNASSIYECSGFRMATEAEWEYAARAGTSTAFFGGPILPQTEQSDCVLQPNLDEDAWYCDNSGGHPHEVGLKRANTWGLHDMEGNIFEWVQSVYVHGYAQLPPVDPAPDGETSSDRVSKGGLWNAWGTVCRSASHLSAGWYTPGPGARLVRTLAPGETW